MEDAFGEPAIKQLLTRVKVYKRDIGQYKSFRVAQNFDYHVQLDNGKIFFKFNDLKNDMTNTLTPIQLTTIANRFIANQSKVIAKEASIQEKSSNSSIVDFFKKLFN